MKALALINLAAREYQDIAFERISKSPVVGSNKANWLDWLNDGQNAIVLARPDAYAITESIVLAPGTRQRLPSGRSRLLDVTCNMGANGSTRGSTIHISERGTHDDVEPDWHAATASPTVDEVHYDEKKDPRTFWVSPPVPASPAVYIEAIMSGVPTAVTDADNGDIALSDEFCTPLQQWMLYRAYAMATQATTQFQRANFYFSSFFQTLGVKIRADMWLGSNNPGTFAPGVAAPNAGR